MRVEKQKPTVVVDTNILLEEPEILQNKIVHFVIPYTVLKELDDLKRRPHLRFAARKAIKAINENLNNLTIHGMEIDESINDDKIISAANETKSELFTEDVAMQLKARAHGVKVFDPFELEQNGYKGYHVLDLEHFNGEGTRLYEEFYRDGGFIKKASIPISLVEPMLQAMPTESEYLVIRFVKNQEGDIGEAIYKLDYSTGLFRRKIMKSVPVSDNNKLSPKDTAQEIALLSATDFSVPATVIDGAVGTGKTLLALASALFLKKKHNLRHIYVTRAPVGVDHRFEIGFLPGNVDEKLSPWIGGILSNLEYLFGEGARGVFEQNFIHFPVNMAQGYSIHKSVIIVDEAQLLSTDVLKQVLSRVAESSKILILGDERQSYGVVPRSEMGLRKLKKVLPSIKEVEYVYLDKIYRGKLAEISLKL